MYWLLVRLWSIILWYSIPGSVKECLGISPGKNYQRWLWSITDFFFFMHAHLKFTLLISCATKLESRVKMAEEETRLSAMVAFCRSTVASLL